jgi:hypothetical protein
MQREIKKYSLNIWKVLYVFLVPVLLLVIYYSLQGNSNPSIIPTIIFSIILVYFFLMFFSHYFYAKKSEIIIEGNIITIIKSGNNKEVFYMEDIQKIKEYPSLFGSRCGIVKWELLLENEKRIYISSLTIFPLFFNEHFSEKKENNAFFTLSPFIKKTKV